MSAKRGVLIGVKSIAIAVVALVAAALTLRAGISLDHLHEMTVASAFAIGLFAATTAALVAFGARPRTTSRAAVGLRDGRPALHVDLPRAHPDVRELPSLVQRALLVFTFACLGLSTFTTDATARIVAVPDDLTKPSRAAYCLPKPKEEQPKIEVAAPVPEPVVDQAGCALVKRAYALGYAKSLGSCAPRAAKPAPVAPVTPQAEEVCDRRELDEPFLHYTWRRLVETVQGSSPVDYASTKYRDLTTRVDYLDDLLADIKHSITGTPHGSHHIWITLPDPHPSSALHVFTGEEPCTSRFAAVPLWPAWSASSPPGAIVEHALGQLLFATRFGTPASCMDYTLHWGASPDACAKLAANPAAFLDAADALEPIRAVLDRRQRQAALRTMMDDLGHPSTMPAPPPASYVASVACLVVAVGAPPAFTGRSITVDGATLQLREAHIAAITPTGAGPVELYTQLARLLAGAAPSPRIAASTDGSDPTDASAPNDAPPDVARPTRVVEPLVVDAATVAAFPLASLEPYAAHDPFTSADVRAQLAEPALVAVYPFDRHLHAFVEAFRRMYFAQRGRL